MNYQLYSDVILLCNLPEEGLYAGDIGTVVEQHQVEGLETGYSVEFFDLLGNTVAITTLPGSYLRSPTSADRPTVRLVNSLAA
ncbi:MAG: DUF4926 domain-containing protein [Oscillatoriales cyanobacterium RU_3_3]|nr:DUF4926 domain-containing protein [Microcoleus sp. SU_5_6]NJL67848.1 DUF4926 domain-containing protein [Microcoleus sp. SM1_3_4]NJM62666.1 DUF4926 domain-containing protein [Oscillatoriales cyanobacterium RU_3_3]NJR24433.1 DUF4926 domain-containing protein [Richelia sp. CSU_2_1]